MKRIVIVDDEPLMLEGFQKAFDWRRYGYEIVAAFRDSSGLEEFCIEQRPDVVILDLGLPYESGVEVLKRLKASMPQMIVIILSAHNEFEYVRDSLRYRADEYLWKPEMNFEDVLKAMNRLIEGRSNSGTRGNDGKIEFIGSIDDEKQFDQQAFYASICAVVEQLNQDKIGAARYEIRRLGMMICSRRPKKQMISVGLNHVMRSYYDYLIRRGENSETAEKRRQSFSEEFKGMNSYEKLYARLMEEFGCSVEPEQEDGMDNEVLKHRIQEYIRKNLSNKKLSLNDVASAVYLSYSYLSRIFPMLLGENFSKYLSRVRVETACRLLRETDMRISRILDEVGYDNQSYFIKIFRHFKNMTPVEYRKMHRKG